MNVVQFRLVDLQRSGGSSVAKIEAIGAARGDIYVGIGADEDAALQVEVGATQQHRQNARSAARGVAQVRGAGGRQALPGRHRDGSRADLVAVCQRIQAAGADIDVVGEGEVGGRVGNEASGGGLVHPGDTSDVHLAEGEYAAAGNPDIAGLVDLPDVDTRRRFRAGKTQRLGRRERVLVRRRQPGAGTDGAVRFQRHQAGGADVRYGRTGRTRHENATGTCSDGKCTSGAAEFDATQIDCLSTGIGRQQVINTHLAGLGRHLRNVECIQSRDA